MSDFQIVAISDTHAKHNQLKIPAGDLLIHAGDFSKYSTEEEVLEFLEWLDDLDFPDKILIAGNHDFYAAKRVEDFHLLMPPNTHYLNDSGVMINSLQIWGSPVQPDLTGWAFGRNRGQEMEEHWELIPSDTDILVTHTPPFGILDQNSSGDHLGCEVLTKKLTQLSPKLHVFGHVHASYGMQKGERISVNASFSNWQNKYNPPITVKLDLNKE